jgi:RNA polymerase sigma-70 factor (ECF subfamily)
MTASAAPIVRRVEPIAPITENDAAPVVALLDPVTRDWLTRLGSNGAMRDEAVAELHALLLRAARFETSRRSVVHPHLRGDLDDIAQEAADDALLAVLARLDDFRGLSRFTTWAYKFALYQASVKVRKRAWQGRELPVEDEVWSIFASATPGPDAEAEQRELLGAIRAGIDEVLTPHQRSVLVALALNDVPIDVLAERLDTTRGALYKTLHDARRKLRRHLEAAGHRPDSSREEAL